MFTPYFFVIKYNPNYFDDKIHFYNILKFNMYYNIPIIDLFIYLSINQ